MPHRRCRHTEEYQDARTWPVMTIFTASLLIGEQLTVKKVMGALLAFAGVAAIVILGADTQAAELDISAGQWVRYSLILLIAPVSAAVVTVISRWYLNRNDEAELPELHTDGRGIREIPILQGILQCA